MEHYDYCIPITSMATGLESTVEDQAGCCNTELDGNSETQALLTNSRSIEWKRQPESWAWKNRKTQYNRGHELDTLAIYQKRLLTSVQKSSLCTCKAED